MPQGARVDDLIEEAGGPTDTADLTDINRAARLIDATTLLVPDLAGAGHGQGYGANPQATYGATHNPSAYTVAGWQDATGHTEAAGAPGRDGRVNLNTASQAELETLPRVGPATARKIIEYREASPFQSVDDLLNIHGIGEKTLEGLRPHVTVN
jgi:competence protein ComEA